MMSTGSISAVIITLNEEKRLGGLLARLNWVDEVVVVDGGSTDKTMRIARRAGCRIAEREFDDFARQRNFAMSLARGDWIFSVDADERPRTKMAAEVSRRIAGGRENAFRVPIHSRIFGRRMRFSGTQDDRPIRIWRRERGRWRDGVHETLGVRGHVGRLVHGLDHETLPDLPSFLEKMNRYTALEAAARVESGRAPAAKELWLGPGLEIFRRLIWKQGFMDGPEGWMFSALSGLSQWVLARRHRVLWHAERETAWRIERNSARSLRRAGLAPA